MVTFAAAAARRDTEWALIARIEGDGVGSAADGAYRYCSKVPTYAAGAAKYRAWIRRESWPAELAERVDLLGGIPDLGSISIELVDVGDALTSAWRTEGAPMAHLNGALTAAATTVNIHAIHAGSSVSEGDILYIGREAMRVTTRSSATQFVVQRARLDTESTKHGDGSAVFRYMPFVRSRRLRIYLAPIDGDDATTEQLFGTFKIEKVALSSDYHAYEIEAVSQHKYLAGHVGAEAAQGLTVIVHNEGSRILAAESRSLGPGQGARTIEDQLNPWADDEDWFLVDDEVIKVDTSTGFICNTPILKRGELGTRAGTDALEDKAGFLVIGADTAGPCAFRHSATNATARGHASFKKSAHFVDIMLCLLTSSADADDGLELVNGDGTYGNWSGLKPGWGLGVPIARLDLASFLKVKQETLGFEFQNFYLAEPIGFAELATLHFLRPAGCYLSVVGDLLTLRRSTIPVVGSALETWGTDVQRAIAVSGRAWKSTTRVGRHTAHTGGAVEYHAKTPSGDEAKIVFRDSDFRGFFSSRTYYADGDKPLIVKCPSVRTDQAGASAMLARMAASRLFRFRRPPLRFGVEASIDEHDRTAGDVVGITHAETPDASTGARGVSALPCEIVSRKLAIAPPRVGFDFELLGYGAEVKIGKIAPSGSIASSLGPSGGHYTLTLRANRYTHTDALGGLPVADAAAFMAGDKVILLNADGTTVAGGVQIVISVSGNDVVVDGNFGGNLADDLIIAFATRGDAISAQHTAYTYWADARGNGDVGTSGDAPWRYGE